MKIIRYFVQLVLLLGLCFSLTTCTFDEVCPPEEDQEIVNYINWIASFGDRYKLTKYVINGVDRTSYLDTLGIRNRVIDFRDYDQPYDRVNRKPNDPSSNCYKVLNYFPVNMIDTISKVNSRNYTALEIGTFTILLQNEVRLGLGWGVSQYVELQTRSYKGLVPSKNALGLGAIYAKVSTFAGGILLSDQIDGIVYTLTLTPR